VRDDCYEFAEKYAGTELSEIAFKLLAGMKGVNPIAKSCCELKTCRRGKPMLYSSDFEVGDTVKVNPEGNFGRTNPGDEGTVKEVDTNMGAYVDGEPFFPLMYYWITNFDNVATFLFCKC